MVGMNVLYNHKLKELPLDVHIPYLPKSLTNELPLAARLGGIPLFINVFQLSAVHPAALKQSSTPQLANTITNMLPQDQINGLASHKLRYVSFYKPSTAHPSAPMPSIRA